MKKKTLWAGTFILGSLAGCAQIEDCCDDHMMSCRDQLAASAAWNDVKHCYEGIDYESDFKDGFKAGYESVAAGGNGCLPALPPRKYWKVCYQTAEGRCQANTWFEGFAHGALAADQDGIQELSKLPVNPGLIQQHIPPGAEHQIHMDPTPEKMGIPPAPAGDLELPSPAPPEILGVKYEEKQGASEGEVELDFEEGSDE